MNRRSFLAAETKKSCAALFCHRQAEGTMFVDRGDKTVEVPACAYHKNRRYRAPVGEPDCFKPGSLRSDRNA